MLLLSPAAASASESLSVDSRSRAISETSSPFPSFVGESGEAGLRWRKKSAAGSRGVGVAAPAAAAAASVAAAKAASPDRCACACRAAMRSSAVFCALFFIILSTSEIRRHCRELFWSSEKHERGKEEREEKEKEET